jgi:hypothetical protein
VAEVTNAQQTTQIPSGQTIPDGGKIDPGASTEPEFEQSPEGSVSFAPSDPSAYTLPELNNPEVSAQLRQGAHQIGLSVSEVEILSEQMTQPDAIWTEPECDKALASMWGSPQEINRHMEVITEAFAPEIERYSDLLDSGLGNNPTFLNLLYQAAQRRLGRY